MNNNQVSPHYKGDRLKQLRGFCQAARLGSISRAAERVMSSQPAISLQVRMLEEELGVLRSSVVAPASRLPGSASACTSSPCLWSRAWIVSHDVFAERHHGVSSDFLRIGAGQTSAAYVLPEFLKRFREQFPGIRVDVRPEPDSSG